MSEPNESPAAEVHRKLAADLFNRVWDLLEKDHRTREEDETMLHAAHASRFHWGEVGQPVNLARGEWQISRVNAVLGRVDAATHHARQCLEISEANGLSGFDIGFAYEALARAAAIAGDKPEHEAWLEKGRAAAEAITDADDRAILLSDLSDMPPVAPPAT